MVRYTVRHYKNNGNLFYIHFDDCNHVIGDFDSRDEAEYFVQGKIHLHNHPKPVLEDMLK